MPEPTTLLVSKLVLRPLIEDLYSNFKKSSKSKLKKILTDNRIKNLHDRIQQVSMVNTIWQVDKKIDLNAFYCNSHISHCGDCDPNGENGRTLINSISDFKTSGNIVIQGIAGQGKSIFLRYLCCSELDKGNSIPIFIELRKVLAGTTLMDRIYEAFGHLALPIDEDLFPEYAKSGKVILLLDAFDEIPESEKNKLLYDLESLAKTFPSLRIIVTTRPDTDITLCTVFDLVSLCHLRNDEYQSVIDKLVADKKTAKHIKNSVKQSSNDMSGLLQTPLMVTLMVVTYKAYQKIPSNLSEFYESLFTTLLIRHDGAKPGYTRPRKSELNDIQIHNSFESMCIFAKDRKVNSFTHKEMRNICQKSLNHEGYKSDPLSLLSDICKITCLLVKDGEEYRFIHKSVQEFFSASFIQRQTDTIAKQFYERFYASRDYYFWHKEIQFLKEIDEYRCNKYLILPALLKILGINDEDLQKKRRKTSIKRARELIGGIILGFSDSNGEPMLTLIGSNPEHNLDIADIETLDIFTAIKSEKLFTHLDQGKIKRASIKRIKRGLNIPSAEGMAEMKSIIEGYLLISLSNLLDSGIYRNDIIKRLDIKLDEAFSRARKISAMLKKHDDSSLIDNIFGKSE